MSSVSSSVNKLCHITIPYLNQSMTKKITVINEVHHEKLSCASFNEINTETERQFKEASHSMHKTETIEYTEINHIIICPGLLVVQLRRH